MKIEMQHIFDIVSHQDVWWTLENVPHLMSTRVFEHCTWSAVKEMYRAAWVTFDYNEPRTIAYVIWGNGKNPETGVVAAKTSQPSNGN